MQIVQHSDDIYEVEDFLTDYEVSKLSLSCNGDGFVEFNPGNIVKNLIPESLEIISSISNKIISYFNDADSHTDITNIRRLKNNEYMAKHVDGGYPNSKRSIVFGIALYLNDDFTGGELNYPDLGISIKPKRSSMVVHDAKLLHEVLPVTSGERYSITTFIFGNEHTKFKL